MDVRQLRCLVAIVDEGSFSGAGRRLGMTQPAVSVQIRRLEGELGEPVFLRDGRRISLTATGEALLPHARGALRALHDAETAVQAARGVVSGTVVFGAMPGCGGIGVPEVLKAFRETYPRVAMRVVEASAGDLIRQVATQEVDVAIVGTPSPSTHGLPARVILETPLVAVTAPDHPLALARTIALRDLLAHEVMCTPKGSGIRAALDVARTVEGLGMTVRYESGNPDMLIDFAAHGLGIAVVPDGASTRARSDVAVIEIVNPEVRGRLELIWTAPSAASPAVREMIRLAERLRAPIAVMS